MLLDDNLNVFHLDRPQLLNASKMIMRPERVTEERLDPSQGQRDCRYGEGSPSGPGRVPGNAAPHPRAAARTCCDDDYESRDAPEPFNAVGVRIIGRRIHQAQMLLQFAEHAAHEQGTSRCVGLEIVSNHDGHSSSLLGTSHGSTHLLAEHLSGASWSDPAIEPAITPVHQAKAVDLAILPRCFNQALPSSTLVRPHARQRRVKGHLHLILQIEVSTWHKREQLRQVGGKLIPQISLDEVMNG